MNWYDTVFETIDLRSFSNLWFWIALAVLWSSASHWVLGVPFDMVVRARRQGGPAEADLDTMAHVQVRRMLYIGRVAGLWLVGLVACMLTTLAILGFWYRVEFAQAVLLMAAPMALVWAISLRVAARIEAEALTGSDLWRRLTQLRFAIQGIGMVAIFVTAMWGMWQNLNSQWN